MISVETLRGSYSSIILHLLLAFCGFSVFVWGLFAEAYAVAFSGLAAIGVSTFAFRRSIPRSALVLGLVGATIGAAAAVPFGFFLGPRISSLFGNLTAAIWGIVIALVLLVPVMALVGRALRLLPAWITTAILLVAIGFGAVLGAINLNGIMSRLYDPVGGMALFGWVAGMAAGTAIGYRMAAANSRPERAR